jgi:hypothetical protein
VFVNTLREFADWFLMSRRGGWFTMPHGPITNLGNVIEIVLYRKPPFQAVMYVFPAAETFPEHVHPDVEQIIVPLSGNIEFLINGESVWTPEQRESWLAGCEKRTDTIHIDGVPHSGIVLTPAAFLSLERWHGEPGRASTNWIGEPASEEQRKLIDAI